MRIIRPTILALMLVALSGGPAEARNQCNTHACALRVEMKHYKQRPMPYCTWGPESNFDPIRNISYHGKPWARGRYLIENPNSDASGKFQFLKSTWRNTGGTLYAPEAKDAKPVIQERLARKLARKAGLVGTWVNC